MGWDFEVAGGRPEDRGRRSEVRCQVSEGGGGDFRRGEKFTRRLAAAKGGPRAVSSAATTLLDWERGRPARFLRSRECGRDARAPSSPPPAAFDPVAGRRHIAFCP